eukprot:5531811-Amphidinium_carterae.2
MELRIVRTQPTQEVFDSGQVPRTGTGQHGEREVDIQGCVLLLRSLALVALSAIKGHHGLLPCYVGGLLCWWHATPRETSAVSHGGVCCIREVFLALFGPWPPEWDRRMGCARWPPIRERWRSRLPIAMVTPSRCGSVSWTSCGLDVTHASRPVNLQHIPNGCRGPHTAECGRTTSDPTAMPGPPMH